MFELVQVREKTYYINCASKIGLCLLDDSEVCLVDSGVGSEAGKRALEIIKERGWTLRMIINTHSHADHVGGNKFLQDATGCPVYAAGEDAAIITNSILNTSLLYGGNPPELVKNKLLYAQSSDVWELDDSVLPPGLEIKRLDGHSFAMTGVKSADGVWFLADVLSSEATLERYHIPFVRDVDKHLETLSSLETLEGELFIPSHFAPLENPNHLAEVNREKVLEIAEKILEICETPTCFEDLMKKIFDTYGLLMDVNLYMISGCAIRSFLSHLCDAGKLSPSFAENRLLWRSM